MENDVICRLSLIISEKGLKKCVVARQAGLTPKKFSDILHGRRSLKAEMIMPLCRAIGCTPNELFDEKEKELK